jgi:hypothetical protein
MKAGWPATGWRLVLSRKLTDCGPPARSLEEAYGVWWLGATLIITVP